MGKTARVSCRSVQRIWAAHGLKPHRAGYHQWRNPAAIHREKVRRGKQSASTICLRRNGD
jgi:hypothetical protein